jgi:hypothetical protein
VWGKRLVGGWRNFIFHKLSRGGALNSSGYAIAGAFLEPRKRLLQMSQSAGVLLAGEIASGGEIKSSIRLAGVLETAQTVDYYREEGLIA